MWAALPAQLVHAYSTGDARIAWRFSRQFELSLVGQNLFQPVALRGRRRSRSAGRHQEKRLRETDMEQVTREAHVPTGC